MNKQLYPHKSVNSKDDSTWLQKRITTLSLRSHRDMTLPNNRASEQKVQFWLNRSQISADSQISPYVNTILYALPFYKYLLGERKWWLLLRAQKRKGRTVWEIGNAAVTFKSDTLQHFFHQALPLSKNEIWGCEEVAVTECAEDFLVFDKASEGLMTAFVCTRRNVHNFENCSIDVSCACFPSFVSVAFAPWLLQPSRGGMLAWSAVTFNGGTFGQYGDRSHRHILQ